MPDEATRLMSGYIPCPHCGVQVRTSEKKCPDCGNPMPEHRTRNEARKTQVWIWIVVALVIALLAVIAAMKMMHG